MLAKLYSSICYVAVLVLLTNTLGTYCLAADSILLPPAETAKEHKILKVEYVGSKNSFLFWELPGLDYVVINNNIVYLTGKKGIYKCRLNAISVDWEAKTAQQKSESFIITITSGSIDPDVIVPPKPDNPVSKVVFLYEVDTTTPDQFATLHNMRETVKLPLFLLDDDLPNPFNLTEQGAYLLDKSNKTIKKLALPVTLEQLEAALKEHTEKEHK